jgi:hypothetical protein
MEGDWLTYEQAAERLNTTPEAVRQKAIRGRWQRTVGNDKRARVRLPDGWPDGVRKPNERTNRRGVRTPFGRASDAPLIKVLEEHVATLKEQLATADARIEKLITQLAAQVEQHAGERAELGAQLTAEQAKTAKAIEAFSTLADRLDALAAANQRQPFLKRLKQRLVG